VHLRIPVSPSLDIAAHRSGNPQGPAVVFLHSLATSRAMWREQVSALGGKYDVIAVDFRGHGDSVPTEGPYTFEQLASDIIATLDYFKLPRAALVGSSLGGIVAVQAALQWPDRISRIVLAGCRLDSPPAHRDLWSGRKTLVEQAGLQALVEPLLAGWITQKSRKQHPTLATLLAHIIRKTQLEAWFGVVSSLMSTDCKVALASLTAPVQIVCGADDPVRAEMSSWAPAMQSASYLEIPDAMHLANLDQPELFSKALLDFLER
jgi:3-oxoadipate enol-lactonase